MHAGVRVRVREGDDDDDDMHTKKEATSSSRRYFTALSVGHQSEATTGGSGQRADGVAFHLQHNVIGVTHQWTNT